MCVILYVLYGGLYFLWIGYWFEGVPARPYIVGGGGGVGGRVIDILARYEHRSPTRVLFG
jgi:hypothetical protein